METEKKYPASIIKAVHAVMTKVEYVVKDGKNEFHKYRYASEAALIAALRPVMLEEGLIIFPSGEELRPVDEFGITHIVLSYTLTHISGDIWPDKLQAFGAGSDKSGKRKDDTFTVGDKGTYKAITGAYKYFIKNLFQLETGTDPEKEKKGSGKTTTEKPATNDKDQKLVNPAQIKRFHAIKRDFEWTDSAAKSLLSEFGYESTKDMEAWEAYGAIIKKLQLGMDGKAKADAKGYCIFANGKDKEKDSK